MLIPDAHFMLKNNSLLSSLFLFIIASTIVSSCNTDESGKTEFDFVAANLRKSPQPFKLKKGQINWNSTQGKQINYLNFYTTYNRPTGAVEVDVQAYDVAHVAVGKTMRLKKRNNDAVDFQSSLGIDQNIIPLADLHIVDANGKLTDFDSLQLTPDTYIHPNNDKYLRFQVRVYKGGIETKEAFYTLPCPPCRNCRPIPDDCPVYGEVSDTDSNAVKKDSLNRQ
ncbi:MAG TPA: hypothetical protein VMZ03_11295 [Chitinophagaceae bacterium]|nr:hypothetical protein [Chitinophagaceae bacterium]